MTETSSNWHESANSGNDNGACIEATDNLLPVRVRDIKDRVTGGLTAIRAAWAAFTAFASAHTILTFRAEPIPHPDEAAGRWVRAARRSGCAVLACPAANAR